MNIDYTDTESIIAYYCEVVRTVAREKGWVSDGEDICIVWNEMDSVIPFMDPDPMVALQAMEDSLAGMTALDGVADIITMLRQAQGKDSSGAAMVATAENAKWESSAAGIVADTAKESVKDVAYEVSWVKAHPILTGFGLLAILCGGYMAVKK